MEKKAVFAAVFISILLLLLLAGAMFVDSAKANGIIPEYKHLPEIVINSNGSVTPETNLIKQIGLTYSLTADVDGYAIRIERSNIVFDGAGHTINTTKGDSPGISLSAVNRVTIKNVEVVGRYTNIYLNNSSHCLITEVKTNKRVYLADGSNFNTITKSNITMFHTFLGNAGNNRIIKNNILQELGIGSSNNFFSQNNFFLTALPYIAGDNFWDDESVGNYWGNYSMEYPNASEMGNGISDTPYVIERDGYSIKEYPDAKNVDNYPLVYPYDIENDAIAFPTAAPQPEPEPFPTALVIAASGASIAIIGIGMLVYFKKRKH